MIISRHKTSILRISVLLFVVCPAASGLDIAVNGTRVSRYESSTLESLARPIHHEIGLSLLEITPLFATCDHIRAFGGSSEPIWDTDDLDVDPADILHDVYLCMNDTVWDLIYGDSRVRGVRSIDISGDLLTGESLEIWIGWEGLDELRAEIEGFAAIHGLDVRVVDVANIRAKLLTVFRARGRMPDIIMIQADYLPVCIELDLLQPVDSIRDATPHFARGDAFESDNHFWAIPFYFDSQIVVYNPELVPPIAHTWNLDDFTRTLEALATDPPAPATWNLYSAYWLMPFLPAFGRETLADSTGAIVVDDPATFAAIRYLLDLADRHLAVPLERDAMLAKFLRGESGLVLTGSFSVPMLERTGVPYAIAPLPEGLSPVHDYKGFAITKRSHHSLAARRMLQHLTSIHVQRDFSERLGKYPARQMSAGEPTADGIPIPPTSAYTIYKNTLWQLLRLIFEHKLTVQDALEQAQSIISGGDT